LCLGSQLGADRLLDLRPITIERRGQFVARRDWPVVARPGGALGVLGNVRRAVLQAFKELLPLGIDRGGILLVAGVEIVDIGGVGALQKGREGKSGIRVLARHDGVLVIFGSRVEDGADADPEAGPAG